MTELGSYSLPPRLDIKHILTEAQNRWLRPAEICEILHNYQKFQIASEPPNRPISGSLFLFDRKVLRYFRKDRHNWRKKKDGKTVKEAHENLKVGSVDVLHCYYAHGEENENFQRRSYWILEQDLMHIVFVHYLEVKGSRTNIGGIKESDEVTSTFQKDSPLSSSFSPNHNRVPCGSTDSPSPASSLSSLFEDGDSEDVFQASSTSRSFLESQPMENGPLRDRTDADVLNSYFPHPSADDHGLSSIPGANYISHVWTDRSRESDDITSPKTIDLDLASWEEVLEHSTRGFHSTVPSNVSSSSSHPASIGVVLEEENMNFGGLLASGSVVKEFQNFVPIQSNWQEMLLHIRLERLLSLISVSPPSHFVEGVPEKRDLISKVISLKEEEEYYQMAEPISQNDPSQYEVKEHLLKILMKEKLYSWLLHKVSEDGKGPSVLDDVGQGVLHLAAALGYDWAIKPIVTSGVSINFWDINGWTALHWASYCGREQTVGFLISLGASPGALTDPSPEFPLGRTPADLAGVNGHKGISGFLAEHLLTSYLKSLEMNYPNEVRTEVSGQKVSEQTVTPANYGDIPQALSPRDSLTAVSNATLAADRIHPMFRMHSLERRWITEYDDDIVRLSDEHALSVVAAKTRKAKQSDGLVHAAATQIQKKFRGWKKRKEFFIIRQRIVKIQAHVRGHQVRKIYRTIIWSDAQTEDPKLQDVPSKEGDYDFLKKGRKQTEERLQKPLTRVKSMVQYPEAQAQCSRLQTAVEGFQETKTSVVAKMGKGKLKDAGNNVRAGWKDPTELKAFCDLCAAQVLNGKRNLGYLKKEGVDAVIKQFGEMGKVVTHMQFKNKWDHLRKQWKTWKEVFEHETGLSYDPITGKIEASDEWWTRKLEACPKASTFKNKPMPNVESMEIMFEDTIATRKNVFCTSGEIPKEPRKKHSVVQETSDSLKNISDVIVESRSVSTRTPFASTAADEVQAVMDMVLTLPGVQSGDRLHMFSTCFFMGNQEARNMFVTQSAQKEIQLRWLEMQYQMNPQFHL